MIQKPLKKEIWVKASTQEQKDTKRSGNKVPENKSVINKNHYKHTPKWILETMRKGEMLQFAETWMEIQDEILS